MREREQNCQIVKNHNTKTKTWRIQIVGKGKFQKGSDLELFFLTGCYVNVQLGFQKKIVQSKIVREGETLLHEGKVVVFGVSLPKKFKKCFSQSEALPNWNFPTLPIPHSLILRKNHAPISFSCVDIADCGFLIKIANFNIMFSFFNV